MNRSGRLDTQKWMKIAFISGLIGLVFLIIVITVRTLIKPPCPDSNIAGTKKDKTVKIGFLDNIVSLIQSKVGITK